VGGDFDETVAELTVEGEKDGATIERQIEQTEEAVAQAAVGQEVDELRKKADEIRTQGIVDGGATIGEGAFEAAGAAKSSNAGWSKAGATGLEGGAKVACGFLSASEANHDATSKLDEQAAERANESARSAHDAASSARSTIDKTLDAYSQIAQAQASASLAIWRPA
jgi:hypothetical protein